jgi:hypothetical protein
VILQLLEPELPPGVVPGLLLDELPGFIGGFVPELLIWPGSLFELLDGSSLLTFISQERVNAMANPRIAVRRKHLVFIVCLLF